MENLYKYLPWFLQNIIISIYGLVLNFKRGREVKLKDFEYESTKNITSFHYEMLLKSIYTAKRSILWNRVLTKILNTDSKHAFFDEFYKLPLTDKVFINKNLNAIHIKSAGEFKLKTSGTTGSGLIFYTTKYAESIMWSYFRRYRSRHGISKNDWCGYFCGRTIFKSTIKKAPYWRLNYFGRQILYSNYHLNENTIIYYLESLNKNKPAWIHGYPSFLFLLVCLAKEKNLTLNYEPKAITFGSENLLSHQKKTIESFFGVKSSELYCQTEGVAMFSQCEKGSMHVDEEFSYVEFIETREKNKFEVVGTSFYNHSFPFFRYRTGDIVELTDETCKCGRHSRVVTNIDGRKEDYILLNNGVKLGRLDHIFKSMVNVIEAQIKQFHDGKVIFYVVKAANYTVLDDELLIREIDSRFNNQINYKLEYVTSIERTKNGKLRFVVRE